MFFFLPFPLYDVVGGGGVGQLGGLSSWGVTRGLLMIGMDR